MVASRCRHEGVDVSVATLLRCRSLMDVAEACERLVGKTAVEYRGPSSITLAPVESGGGLLETDLTAIHNIHLTPEDVKSVSPCTPMQEGLLLRQTQSQKSVPGLNRIALRVTSSHGTDCISGDKLVQAWIRVCNAFDILRTVFASSHDGLFRQIVLKHGQPWIEEVEGDVNSLRKYPAPAVLTESTPPHRFLFSCTPDAAWIRIDISHVPVDPSTVSKICEQLALACQGTVAAADGPSLGFFTKQIQRRRGESLKFWTDFLIGASPTLIQPITRADSNLDSGRGKVRVPLTHGSRMTRFCKQYVVTSANVLQVAWAAALRLLTLNPRPTFGCVIDERYAMEGASGVMGPLLAMTVCKVDLTQKRSISALLSQVREDFATGLQNTALSLAELHDSLGLTTSPLFNTVLSLVRHEAQIMNVAGHISVTTMEFDDNNEYAIMVKAASSETIEVWLDYDKSQITPFSASAIAEMFATTVEIALESPSEPVDALLKARVPPMAGRAPFSLLRFDVASDVKRKATLQTRLPKGAIEDIIPCMPSQESLIAASITETQQNLAQYVFEAVDEATFDRLKQAWEKLFATHAVLRTRIVSLDGLGTFQVIAKPAAIQWATDDDLDDFLEWDRAISVSYGEPCCRLGSTLRSGDGCFLIASIHRAVCDERAWRRLIDDLDAAYHHRDLNDMAPPRAMMGFISGQDRKESVRFWERRLQGFEEAVAFPELALGPADQVKRAALSTTVATPTTQCEVSARILFNAGWALCLSRISGSRQCTFGWNVDIRDALPATIENPAIGLTSVTVPFPVDIDSNSTGEELIASVETLLLDMLPFVFHYDEVIKSGGDASSTSSFHTVLAVTDKPHHALFANPLPVPVQVAEIWKPPLIIECEVSAEGSRIDLDFDSTVLSPERADLLLHQYVHAIDQLVSQTHAPLSYLRALSEPEMDLLGTCNAISLVASRSLVHDAIADVARKNPRATAVSSWDGSLSYQELESLSSLGTGKLLDQGMQENDVVPVLFEKSAATIIAYLAILKAGGAILPLDVTQPDERLKSILSSAHCSIAISSRGLRSTDTTMSGVIAMDLDDWKALSSSKNALFAAGASAVGHESVCYVIFTSGSTGTPKGIEVTHLNLMTAAMALTPQLGITTETKTLQATNLIFDASMGDIFFTLLAGGCLCVPREPQLREDISATLHRTGANFAFITPTMARLLIPSEVPTLKTLALIGEPVTREIAEAWAPRVRFLNCYGPAETTILTSCNHVSAQNVNRFANVGIPPASRYWIVDPADHNILVPLGCSGELLIEGPQAARGYLGDGKQTVERFIPPPRWFKEFPGFQSTHRLYKTGDIAMQEPDGSVVIQGRKDTQIKLRGRRIELGDVEFHLRRVADTSWSVVVETFTAKQDIVLAAFMAPMGKENSSEMMLRPLEQGKFFHRELRRVLPGYMVPEIFIRLDVIPRSGVGKTDRKRLREMGAALSPQDIKRYSVYNAPDAQGEGDARGKGTMLESQMCRLWPEVLDIPMSTIATTDNFFALGGNSIRVGVY